MNTLDYPSQMALLNVPRVEGPRLKKILPDPTWWWKLPWERTDVIYFKCGHEGWVPVLWLENRRYKVECPYKEWGGCNG